MSLQDGQSVLQSLRTQLLEIDERNLDGQVVRMRENARGWGGYGYIYRGFYNLRVVCIKVFKYVDLEQRETKFIQRLKRELKIWCRLTHCHIVQLHGWLLHLENENEPCPSLVSNWCEDGSAVAFLRGNTNVDRTHLICGIGKGLEYLHSEGIVHGDVKPDNVVISDNEAQLCDFGLSSILSDVSTHATSTSLVGTLRYLAPELFLSPMPFRTKKSDVWAFGCTAMEILRNQKPHETICNMMHWQLQTALYWASQQGERPFKITDPSPLEEKLMCCMEYDANLRPDMDTIMTNLDPEYAAQATSLSHPTTFTKVLEEALSDYRGLNLEDVVFTSSPVYKGRHWELCKGLRKVNNQAVRLKVLRLTLSDGAVLKGFVHRIMEQTRIWYKARHPNVAKVHGWMLQVDDSGSLQACLISTWYPNGDITSYLLQHPEADREDLICNICWGLKHLHANDTVHGDLKPTNVMMGNRGIAILCDFGLSSFLHGASSSAFTGALHGLRSVRYTAPQLLEDNSVNPCSKEADIWAFGCVSIEILSGQRPYNKIDDENDLCNKILDGEPAYTPDVFQRVKVKDIIKDCLKVPALKRPHVKALINVLAP